MCTAKRVVRGFDREKQERGDFAGVHTHGVRPVAFVPEATPTKASTVAYRAQMQLRMEAEERKNWAYNERVQPDGKMNGRNINSSRYSVSAPSVWKVVNVYRVTRDAMIW